MFVSEIFVEPNSAGSTEPSATPLPFGPRNCSQSLEALAEIADEAAAEDVAGFEFWALF